MKKRIRKKLAVGEYGVEIMGRAPVEVMDMHDRLIDAAESRHLMIGGGGGEYVVFYVMRPGREVTQDDVDTLAQAMRDSGVTEIKTKRYWSRI